MQFLGFKARFFFLSITYRTSDHIYIPLWGDLPTIMQSILQYRRFGQHVRAQYERDKKRAEALERGNAENIPAEEAQGDGGHRPSSIDTKSSVTESPDSRDPEKAEQPPSRDENQRTAAEGSILVERSNTLVIIETNQSFGTRMGHALSGIEVRQLSKELTRTRSTARKTKSNEKDDEERETVFVVSYESEKDNMNPHNWAYWPRIGATILIAGIGFVVGFASAIDSAALPQAARQFGVSEVTESLATGLYLVGLGIGALYAGPVSETVGRNPVYIVSLFIYMIWIMAAGLAPNISSQLIFRFLAGFFGSTPLTCAGGSLSDLWDPMERVYTFPVFANAAFMGPILGPVLGGFIGESNAVSWKWCEWVTLIMSGLILGLVVLFQRETYAPVLLKWKASHLRKLTGDDRYVAEVEIRADPFRTRLLHALYRPFLLTAREPIIILFALYITVVYIILFTFLDGYTYVFGETYGFSQGITGLAFLGIGTGLCVASLLVPLIHHVCIPKFHPPPFLLPK